MFNKPLKEGVKVKGCIYKKRYLRGFLKGKVNCKKTGGIRNNCPGFCRLYRPRLIYGILKLFTGGKK